MYAMNETFTPTHITYEFLVGVRDDIQSPYRA